MSKLTNTFNVAIKDACSPPGPRGSVCSPLPTAAEPACQSMKGRTVARRAARSGAAMAVERATQRVAPDAAHPQGPLSRRAN
eukprot:scaffold3068_cov401-Prasinococcus_capsulatus_cf.AAC.36